MEDAPTPLDGVATATSVLLSGGVRNPERLAYLKELRAKEYRKVFEQGNLNDIMLASVEMLLKR